MSIGIHINKSAHDLNPSLTKLKSTSFMTIN